MHDFSAGVLDEGFRKKRDKGGEGKVENGEKKKGEKGQKKGIKQGNFFGFESVWRLQRQPYAPSPSCPPPFYLI